MGESKNIEERLLDEFLEGGFERLSSKRNTSKEHQKAIDEIEQLKEISEASYYTSLRGKINTDIEVINTRKRIRNIIYRVLFIGLLTLAFVGYFSFYNTSKETVYMKRIKENNLKPSLQNTVLDTHNSEVIINEESQNKSLHNTVMEPNDHQIKTIERQDNNTTDNPPFEVEANEVVQALTNFDEEHAANTAIESIEKQALSITKQACAPLQDDITYKISEPCIGKGNGEILVSIKNSIHAKTHLQSLNNNSTIQNLYEGIYTVYLNDDNGCSDSIKIQLTAKPCLEQRNYNFAPEYDGEIVIETEISSILEIRDRKGLLIQTLQGDFNSPFIWDARDINGDIVYPGTYIYFMKKSTGDLISTGQITVMR